MPVVHHELATLPDGRRLSWYSRPNGEVYGFEVDRVALPVEVGLALLEEHGIAARTER